MTKTWFLPPVLAAAAALTILAGCGGGGGDGSSSGPASVAPPEATLFAEANLRPSGSLKANVEAIASRAGIEDPGGRIVEEIEKSARDDGEPFDFEEDVEPWLGDTAGLFASGSEEDDATVALEATDTDAAQEFVDEKMKADGGGEPEDASYEGVDYKLDTDGDAAGIVDEYLVIGPEEEFKAAVDASDGDSLADSDKYNGIASEAAEGSLADVYLDLGALLEESGDGGLDPEAKKFFEAAGLDLEDAATIASLVPGTDQVEIDVASHLVDTGAPAAPELLASLPAGSAAAVAGADFGKTVGEVIDSIDEEGIAGEVPPHELKSTLKKAGIDLDRIAGSIGDIGVFAEGESEPTLGGAIVLTTDSATEAANTVNSVGFLVRANDVPGVTAVGGKATGFSVPGVFGEKPLVIAAKGERIAIGYGLPATLRGLAAEHASTLGEDPAYREAVAALGGSEISGFADGDAALRFAGGVISEDDRAGFEEARPYLENISYVAIGSDTEGDLAKTKLIAGLAK